MYTIGAMALPCPDEDMGVCSPDEFFTFVRGLAKRHFGRTVQIYGYSDASLGRNIKTEVGELMLRPRLVVGRAATCRAARARFRRVHATASKAEWIRSMSRRWPPSYENHSGQP